MIMLHHLRGHRRLGSVVNHRVGVFHAHAVGSALLLEQIHQGIVMFLVLPVALEFQNGGNSRQPGWILTRLPRPAEKLL